MSNSLWPQGLQHARLACPSLSPGVCSNSCPLSQWCHPTISSSVTPYSCPQSSQHQGIFQWVSSVHQVAKYWSFSFSISPSNECSELISFRIDWFNLLEVQGSLKSLLQHHNSKASILLHMLFNTCLHKTQKLTHNIYNNMVHNGQISITDGWIRKIWNTH